MGSSPVGAQSPLTSSSGEFLGSWDWLWYPGLSPVLVSIALPLAFHVSVFSIHTSSQPLDFIRLFSRWRNLHPTTNPPPYSRLGTGPMVIGYPKRSRYHGG